MIESNRAGRQLSRCPTVVSKQTMLFLHQPEFGVRVYSETGAKIDAGGKGEIGCAGKPSPAAFVRAALALGENAPEGSSVHINFPHGIGTFGKIRLGEAEALAVGRPHQGGRRRMKTSHYAWRVTV